MPWTAIDRSIMQDVYRLMQMHCDPLPDEAYWDGLIRQAQAIYDKYNGDDLAFDMVCAVLNHLERKLLRAKKG